HTPMSVKQIGLRLPRDPIADGQEALLQARHQNHTSTPTSVSVSMADERTSDEYRVGSYTPAAYFVDAKNERRLPQRLTKQLQPPRRQGLRGLVRVAQEVAQRLRSACASACTVLARRGNDLRLVSAKKPTRSSVTCSNSRTSPNRSRYCAQ